MITLMTGLWRLWPLHVNKYYFAMSHLVLISWFLSGTFKLMECFLWNEIKPSYISFPKWTISCSCLRFRSSGNIMSTEKLVSDWNVSLNFWMNFTFHFDTCISIHIGFPRNVQQDAMHLFFILYLLESVWFNTPSLLAGGHQKA